MDANTGTVKRCDMDDKKLTKEEILDTLNTWIERADDEYDREEMGRVEGMLEAVHLIKRLEDRPKGKWIIDGDLFKTARCSCCQFETDPYSSKFMKYCQMCGADMQAGDENG